MLLAHTFGLQNKKRVSLVKNPNQFTTKLLDILWGEMQSVAYVIDVFYQKICWNVQFIFDSPGYFYRFPN